MARGIRYLSQTSMGLGALLFTFVLVAGPTIYLANLYVQSVGQYLGELVSTSLISPAAGDLGFMQSWTYFMLAWWLSWAAFVGVFLARISRGRTVREFVVGVLCVPSVVFSLWFTVFGGTALHRDLAGITRIASTAAVDANSAFFETLQSLPLSTVTSALTIVLVVLFFVSGADANTFVLGMLTSHGTQHPPARILALWGVVTGAAAGALLLAGGLESLRQMVIVSSAPFLLVVLGVAISLSRDLAAETASQPPTSPAAARQDVGKPEEAAEPLRANGDTAAVPTAASVE